MHPYDPSHPENYWATLLARLKREIPAAENVFGDVERAREHFEHSWWYRFEPFHNADRLTAQLASRGARPPSPAFIIRFDDAARDVVESDYVMWATSLEEAIAYVLECCRHAMVLPDSVRFDPAEWTMSATLDGKPFVDIGRMPTPSSRSSELRKRAYSTLVGYRKSEHPKAELCRRIARWPGASKVRINGEFDATQRVRLPHLPVPSEWLWMAEQILAQAGLPSDANASQRLVASTLGAKDFNTLVHSSSEFIAGLAGPWVVAYLADEPEVYQYRISADPFTSYCDFIDSFRAHGASWKDAVLGVSSAPRLESMRLTIENDVHTLKSAPDSSISMRQVDCAWPKESGNLEAVRTALNDETGELLSDLFLASASPAERLGENAVRRELDVIASSEGWTFAVKPTETDQWTKRLYVFRSNAAGNVEHFESVPCYKGTLVFDSQEQCWVLFSDNRHSRPVAVMRRLSSDAVSAVCKHLVDSTQPYHGVRRRDLPAFRRLLAGLK